MFLDAPLLGLGMIFAAAIAAFLIEALYIEKVKRAQPQKALMGPIVITAMRYFIFATTPFVFLASTCKQATVSLLVNAYVALACVVFLRKCVLLIRAHRIKS